jgi:hypothetical protein
MKTALLITVVSLFYSCALADDVPIAIGVGSDTVWFKTGKNLSMNSNVNTVTVPEYGATVFYAPDKTVESILLGLADSSTKYTLRGVGLGDNKKDVVAKLGAPSKEFPKDKDEVFNAYQAVWVLKDQLLIVGLWQDDQAAPEKHAKDSVAWVVLRKAHF